MSPLIKLVADWFGALFVLLEANARGYLLPVIIVLLSLLIWLCIHKRYIPLFVLTRKGAEDFMKKIDIKKVNRIMLLAHTGQYLYKAVHARLEDIRDPQYRQFKERLEIIVLIRHPKIEAHRRNKQIEGTQNFIKSFQKEGFNIKLCHYKALPAYRGIICEFVGGKRSIFFSGYFWPTIRSRSWPFALLIKDKVTKQNRFAMILESWITHYIGSGRVHTVVFDFDDTLAITTELQVDAWIKALDKALKGGRISDDDFALNVLDARTAGERFYRDCITNLFLEKQEARKIVDAILQDVPDSTKELIDKDRFDIRARLLMENGRLFPGAVKVLEELNKHYQLAIVTATSSQLVRDFLNKWKASEVLELSAGELKQRKLDEGWRVADYFSIFLGKEDPRHEWANVHTKSIRLLEVSDQTGVPLDRIVFVGDNNSDYNAARQLGIRFIEAGMTARRHQRESLIDYPDDGEERPARFESYTNNELVNLIETINRQVDYFEYWK